LTSLLPMNVAGGRRRLIPVTWMDANGSVWLFGGQGYDSTGNQGELNDLWEYSPSSGKWTWVGSPGSAGAGHGRTDRRAQMFASMLHHAVSRIDLPKLLPAQNVILTPRERECLRWSADGKTAWEIGQILSIAERTVVFHVNNVIQKLSASNKTQAIVRAITLNLL